MFTLSIAEGFARGLVSLHTPPLLGRKPSSAKSRVSITSKLIEIKGLQLQHFGHLRKTGGRGSYQLPTHHPLFPPRSFTRRSFSERGVSSIRRSFSEGGSPLFPLHTKTTLVCPLFPLHTQKWRGTPPVENVGAPTFLIFTLIFRTFLSLAGPELGHFVVAELQIGHSIGRERWPRRSIRGAKDALERPAIRWGTRLDGGGVEGLAFG